MKNYILSIVLLNVLLFTGSLVAQEENTETQEGTESTTDPTDPGDPFEAMTNLVMNSVTGMGMMDEDGNVDSLEACNVIIIKHKNAMRKVDDQRFIYESQPNEENCKNYNDAMEAGSLLLLSMNQFSYCNEVLEEAELDEEITYLRLPNPVEQLLLIEKFAAARKALPCNN